MPPSDPANRLQVEMVDGVMVVSLMDSEIVDDFSLNGVRDALYTLIDERKPPRLVLNLVRVRKYSTQFLGNLIAFKSRLRKAKGVMKICCIAPNLMDAVKILHLERDLDIYPEEQAAVNAF